MILKANESSGQSILLIDDDLPLLKLMEYAFSLAGYQVYTATDGQAGLRQFFDHQPDLVILDVVMPGMDGWETCRKLRQLSTIPIIMLTCLKGNEHIICGLDEGADDYLFKPVELKVLMAQVRAKLRRVALPPPLQEILSYSDGYLTIDPIEQRVLVHGQLVQLTPREYDLLAYLYRHADQLRPHRQILEDVWGWQVEHPIDVVHKNMRRLRQKLEEDPKQPRYLLTKYGIGYRFKKQSPSKAKAVG